MIATPLQILMVEDDDAYAALVQRFLRSSGSELIVAPRMDTALRHLAARRFDIVLSDLNLPDSRGFETFQRLLAAAPRLPIVVLTGEDDDALGLRTVQAGGSLPATAVPGDSSSVRTSASSVISKATLPSTLRMVLARSASSDSDFSAKSESLAPL